MALDINAGRQLEIDIIFGVVVRKAKAHNITVPTLEVVYALLMGINSRLGGEKQS
jgi:ketopantoate reductase